MMISKIMYVYNQQLFDKFPARMNEANQLRLRQSANNLIQAIGPTEERVKMVAPFLDTLLGQIQSRLQPTAPSMMIPSPVSLQAMQRATGVHLNNELFRIAVRLAGFNAKESPVAKEITRRFGANIKQGELINIAQVIADTASIKLDRDAKRRKNVLLKWFDEHWSEITPYLDYIVLEEGKGGEEGQTTSG